MLNLLQMTLCGCHSPSSLVSTPNKLARAACTESGSGDWEVGIRPHTTIESLIPALTARVLQLYAAVPTRAGVFTTVTRKICNYWNEIMNKIMNNNILGGGGFSRDRPGRTNYSATGISLAEMLTF